MSVFACAGVFVAGLAAGMGFDALVRVSPVAAVGCVFLASYFYLAALILRSKKLARARLDVELDPTNPLAHHVLAMALHDKGEIDEAARAFRNSIDLEPSLGLSRPGETLRVILAARARSAREKAAVRALMRLARIDYIAEQSRRSGWVIPQDCRQAMESVRAEISGLEVMKAELRSFVSGSEYYEDNLLIEHEMRQLRERLARLEEMMRQTDED